MAAAAAFAKLNVEDRTIATTIPRHDVAHLMYYLKSVNSLGRRQDTTILRAPKNLTDYANWQRLSSKDIRDLVAWCRRLAPAKSPVKDFTVCDVDREVCGKTDKSDCAFFKVSADIDIVAIGRNAMIAGAAKGVGGKHILFYTPEWLTKYYTDPLKNVSIYHCAHCTGVERGCRCQVEKCDRPWASRCYILRPHEHRFKCDGCKDELYVTGVLYMCSLCSNYGLCRRCYKERRIHDLTHPFQEIAKPGAQPVLLSRRKASKPSVMPSSGQDGPETPPQAPFTKGDVVILKGLARADMDGQEATVLNIDVANQKAQIRINGIDKTFKVKWVNIEPAEDLEGLEELE